MAGSVKNLKKGDILFREGDPSDAMYVIKSGRIGITKAKGNKEINLAELVPGEMLGEMAFFDNKPRSAGAKALADSQVIILPFTALHAQFKTFPEWLKSMVKTVNSHLRNANLRIKNLESGNEEDQTMFTPYTITRFCAIISLIGFKAGEKVPEGIVIPQHMLRNYTIQVFQQPTNKMQKMMETLSALRIMKIEELGEGRQKITILNHQLLSSFVDWYNEYLFKEESKRITITEKEMPTLKAVIFYGKQKTPNDKGVVEVSLTDIQNNSMKDLNYLVSVNDVDTLIEKKLLQDKKMLDGGQITTSFSLKDVESIYPFWELVYVLTKVPGR